MPRLRAEHASSSRPWRSICRRSSPTTCSRLLREKAEEAWRHLGRPLIVEETGLELQALGGFPGPLIKWMLHRVGPEGVARTAHALGDPRAYARCALCYRDEKGSVIGDDGAWGDLVLPPRGDTGFGWDPVFQPVGGSLTCAELGDEAKDRIAHRGRGWRGASRRARGGSAGSVSLFSNRRLEDLRVVQNRPMSKTVSITVRLPADLRDRLAARARKAQRSLSAQIALDLEGIDAQNDDRGVKGTFLGLFEGSRVPTDEDFVDVRRALWGRLRS